MPVKTSQLDGMGIWSSAKHDADAMDEVGGHDYLFSHRLNTDETRMKNAK
jgi:hypothetical protein